MSKQLALSSAFSIFMMAAYVLLGAHDVRESVGFEAESASVSPVEISATVLTDTAALLPSVR